MTEVADTSSSHASASNGSIELATQYVSEGATGTRTATGSLADLRPCGVMIALNPANIGAAPDKYPHLIYLRKNR